MPIPIGVEPAAVQVTLDEGAVLTMALPGRGHVSIRVEAVTDDHVIVSTLRGHVLAGFVRFATAAVGDEVMFEVMPCDSAANVFDWVALTLGGARIQDANWTKLAHNVAMMAGRSAKVEFEARTLTAVEAVAADRWISHVIRARQQRDHAA
jgi:NADH dehydrogenase